MTMLMSVLKITTKEETLLWMHLLSVEFRSSELTLHTGLLGIPCLISLWQFLHYLVYRFLWQPALALRFWYLFCITLRGLH